MGGLHGVVHRVEQIATHGPEVDLVAQSSGEGVEGPLGVVLRSVEAPIDRGLDPPPEGLEQRDDASVEIATATPLPAVSGARIVCSNATPPT